MDFVVADVVLGRHRCIGHRRDNENRAKQAKDGLSHRSSPSFIVMHRAVNGDVEAEAAVN
jgi:hypothetical protein